MELLNRDFVNKIKMSTSVDTKFNHKTFKDLLDSFTCKFTIEIQIKDENTSYVYSEGIINEMTVFEFTQKYFHNPKAVIDILIPNEYFKQYKKTPFYKTYKDVENCIFNPELSEIHIKHENEEIKNKQELYLYATIFKTVLTGASVYINHYSNSKEYLLYVNDNGNYVEFHLNEEEHSKVLDIFKTQNYYFEERIEEEVDDNAILYMDEIKFE